MSADAPDTINTALARAAPNFAPVVKNRTNSHFGSKYADLDAVLAAVRPALLEQGIVIVSDILDGPQTALLTRLIHGPSGTEVSAHVPLLLEKQSMQKLGGAITYARRYALGMLLGVAPEDDDDGNATRAPDRVPAAVAQAQDKAAALLEGTRQAIKHGDADWLTNNVLNAAPAVRWALSKELSPSEASYIKAMREQQQLANASPIAEESDS